MKKNHGVSLIELMVVVAILAILTTLGVPAYTTYLAQSRRVDAQLALVKQQAYFEQQRALTGAYPTTLACSNPNTGGTAYPSCPSTCTVGSGTATVCSDQGFYNISISSSPAETATTYTLTATAVGSQTSDTSCVVMTLDQTNNKLGGTTAGTQLPGICW